MNEPMIIWQVDRVFIRDFVALGRPRINLEFAKVSQKMLFHQEQPFLDDSI